MAKNFCLVGAAGYIAPRHMQAIYETGNRLVAAVDPHDCVGRLDSYFPNARFFTEIERFDRYIEKCRRGPESERVHYVSVCSPNYLHDAHVRLALRVGAHAICEKPLVVSPWNLDALEDLERESERRVFSVLQLRLIPALIELKEKFKNASGSADVCLSYITRRGRWYDTSWKGSAEKSGGISMNIGIHFFDILQWIFGAPLWSEVHLKENRKMAGMLELEKARVRWFLSTDENDVPAEARAAGKFAHRSITVDDNEVEFSDGFTDLHTRVYEQILSGQGTGIGEARPAIRLVHQINHTEPTAMPKNVHPLLDQSRSQPYLLPLRAAA